MSIPLQRVLSLHFRVQDNTLVASYWLHRVLDDWMAGAETRGVHRTTGAGGEARNAPLSCLSSVGA